MFLNKLVAFIISVYIVIQNNKTKKALVEELNSQIKIEDINKIKNITGEVSYVVQKVFFNKPAEKVTGTTSCGRFKL